MYIVHTTVFLLEKPKNHTPKLLWNYIHVHTCIYAISAFYLCIKQNPNFQRSMQLNPIYSTRNMYAQDCLARSYTKVNNVVTMISIHFTCISLHYLPFEVFSLRFFFLINSNLLELLNDVSLSLYSFICFLFFISVASHLDLAVSVLNLLISPLSWPFL